MNTGIKDAIFFSIRMPTSQLPYPIRVLQKELVLTDQRWIFGVLHVAVNHHQNKLVPSSLSLAQITIQSAMRTS